VLNVRNKPGNYDQVDRATSKDLIGDMHIAALRIVNLRYHGTALLKRSECYEVPVSTIAE
jgi:hypothetical protein